jgi:hypothetical protein
MTNREEGCAPTEQCQESESSYHDGKQSTTPLTALPRTGAFSISAHEDAFDRIMMIWDYLRLFTTFNAKAFIMIQFMVPEKIKVNPLTPELNPSARRCLTRFFIRDFGS